MSRKFFAALLIGYMLLSSISFSATYGGGSGTAADPYQIWTAEQMNTIGAYSADWGKCFILMADIDMSAYTGTQYNIIGTSSTKFTGKFDGNGHKIINLTYITTTPIEAVGVFGYVSFSEIKNLGVENVNISAPAAAGGLAAFQGSNSTITNCYTTGSVSSSYTDPTSYITSFSGGLVGRQSFSTLSNCYSTCSVGSSTTSGGLVAVQWDHSTITNCYATGSVCSSYSSSTSSVSCVSGGLVGIQLSSAAGYVISNCYSTSTVTCSAVSSYSGATSYAGGLFGILSQYCTVSSCYATGSVSSISSSTPACANNYSYAGGLAGDAGTCAIINVYATGSVSSSCTSTGTSSNASSYVGGLVGNMNGGSITTSYSIGKITANGTGKIFDGGLVGLSPGTAVNCVWDIESSGINYSAGGRGCTTFQMKQLSNYLGWNVPSKTTWTINDGVDYPRLSWENQPGVPLGTLTLSDIIPGAGTIADPYRISTPEQFGNIGLFSDQWDKVYSLENSIDMAGWFFNIIGNQTKPFKGTFNGNGYVISNLTCQDSGMIHAVGVFGNTSGATLTRLGLENINISSQGDYVGALVGCQENGTISDCYSTGTVSSLYPLTSYGYTGGLVGAMKYKSLPNQSRPTLANCFSTCSVTATYLAGGLAGSLSDGYISNCHSGGSVLSSSTAGGLLGGVGTTLNIARSISNCYNTGDVTASSSAGGLVGSNSNYNIENCYNTGNVTVSSTNEKNPIYAGGLTGYHSSGTLKNCYNTGNVAALNTAPYTLSGTNVYAGGLAAWQNAGTISGCYSTGSVTCNRIPSASTYTSYSYSYGGGLVGYQYGGNVTHCYNRGSVIAYSPWSVNAGGVIGMQYNGASVISYCYSTGSIETGGCTTINRGGLVGLSDGIVMNCFWDTQTSGLATSGGGKGRTTAQMKQMDNYIGWNTPVLINWTISEGIDYPRLSWEGQPGTALGSQVFGDFVPGTGTTEDPYRISTPLQLGIIGLFSDEWSKVFVLKNSIDMVGGEHNKIGNYAIPFKGVFDGNNFVISNFNYAAEKEKGVGFFGVAGGMVIKNMGLENVNITSRYDYAGGLIGEVMSGTVANCYVTGTIQGINSVGGLAGRTNTGVTVSSCHSDVSIAGKDAIGGLIGIAYGTVTLCYSNSTVNAEKYAGGLIGISYAAITNCSSTGSTNTTASFTSAGGLAGYINGGTLSNCHSNQAVTSAERGGGLAGEFYSGTITNCYSEGSVNVSADSASESSVYAGGLFGLMDSSCTITNCYSSASVYACSYAFAYAGGLVGRQMYSTISGSNSSGSVTAVSKNPSSSANANAGGLVGDQYGGTITNCYSMSNVNVISPSSNSIPCVGGLVGMQETYATGKIDKCYSMGGVKAAAMVANKGGFLGSKNGTITSCFWDTQASGLATSAGGTGVQGKTTAEMLKLSTFTSAGWDFSDADGNPAVWVMNAASYPLLSWENSTSIVQVPDLAEMTDTNAQIAITAAGLTGVFIYTFNDTIPLGYVISQNPIAGTDVYLKTVVLVEISRGKKYFESGSGSSSDPYLIATPEQMNAIGKNPLDWDKCFKLIADLDMSAYTGTQYHIIGNENNPFSGTFDGNYRRIKNLRYSCADFVSAVGLFSYLNNATIKNLSLDNLMFSVNGQYAGGVAGVITGGYITGCDITGSITATGSQGVYVGGLAAYVSTNAVFAQSCSTASVSSSSSSAHAFSGGLTGYFNSSTISNCYSTGAVTALASTSCYAGGLTGSLLSSSCKIEKSYSTGKITASGATVNKGGLIGYSTYNVSSYCFWDTQTSGLTTSAGGSLVVGRTTAQMKTQSTFYSWDFASTWYMADYPSLRWEINPLQAQIDAAANGAAITIQPGLYQGRLYFKGKNITLTSTNPQDSTIVASTTIRGLGTGPVISFAGTETSACVLQGFTIENGNGNGIYGGAALTAATIRNCVIRNNANAYNGGGIANCSGLIANCILRNNTATTAGSAMYQCNGQIVNCTIVPPSSSAISLVSDCAGSFTNCILAGTGTIFNNCTGPITYSCYPGAYGTSNISVDPLFINAAAGDYHLLPDSPCNDASDPASDYFNEPFPNGSRVDMGAYGNTPESTNSRDGLVPLGLVTINKIRAGRTSFEYELAVTVHNSNAFAMTNVQMKLMDWDMAVQSVSDDSITIASIPAGMTATSTDTFKIVVDRSQPIVSSRLTWVLTYYGIGGQVQQAMMSMPLSAIDATVPGDITGDGSVNMEDFMIMAQQWNTSPGTPSADIALPLNGYVGIEDLLYLAANWMK